MTLQLTYNDAASVPLEVEGVLPEHCRDRSLDEIRGLPVLHGNRPATFGDFFQVAGDPSDERLVWEGNLSGVHWIGTRMASGEILVRGNAGRHVGSEMRGGTIRVEGNAGDWVGGEMKGGSIAVLGDAGHLVGAAYRGSPRGMTGGSIFVHGRAGNEVGHTMRRGLIAIGGDVGDLLGFNMLAGSILVMGAAGIRPGAGMRRGTLGFFGSPPELLLSFRRACRFQPVVLQLILGEASTARIPAT